MRIIGGNDYYDSAVAYGIDKTIVYMRNRFTETSVEVPELAEKKPYFRTSYSKKYKRANGIPLWRGTPEVFEPIIIWFAGKRYPAIIEDYTPYGNDPTVIYDAETFLKRVKKHDMSLGKALHNISGFKESYGSDNIKEYFEVREANKQELEYFISNRVAIAVSQYARITSGFRNNNELKYWYLDCDNMKELGFASVLDPWTAFQELSMFVGGVWPRQENKTVTLSDDDILRKHGFDEWTMRKKVR